MNVAAAAEPDVPVVNLQGDIRRLARFLVGMGLEPDSGRSCSLKADDGQ